MKLFMDSTFKRVIFLVVVTALGVLFLYTAFFYLPQQNQKFMIIYLLVIQSIVLLTFFTFRDQHAYRLRSVKKLKNPRLQENAFQLGDLLLKDYDYIRDTMSQAMNDRHTMVNYFLLIAGAIITIVITNLKATALLEPQTRYFLILGALVLNFIGWIYFMHIIRLRQAWHGSALAMNQIKEFFVQNGRVPDDIARSSFLWDTKTVPAAGRKSNVFYYSAALISFITSLSLIFSSYIASLGESISYIPTLSWIIGIYHFIFQMMCFSLFLDYSSPRKQA